MLLFGAWATCDNINRHIFGFIFDYMKFPFISTVLARTELGGSPKSE